MPLEKWKFSSRYLLWLRRYLTTSEHGEPRSNNSPDEAEPPVRGILYQPLRRSAMLRQRCKFGTGTISRQPKSRRTPLQQWTNWRRERSVLSAKVYFDPLDFPRKPPRKLPNAVLSRHSPPTASNRRPQPSL